MKIEQAIPHESGHTLVGRLVGIPVCKLDHEVILDKDNQVRAGNFATAGLAPLRDPRCWFGGSMTETVFGIRGTFKIIEPSGI